MANNSKLIFAACAAILFAGCTTPPKTEAQLAEAAKADARQGEEVRNICFAQQIRNWRAEGRNAVIVETDNRKEYKLDLVGGCQPDNAFTSIGLISRTGGGSCVSSGDQLVADVRYTDGICMISKIHKWNKEAATPGAAS